MIFDPLTSERSHKVINFAHLGIAFRHLLFEYCSEIPEAPPDICRKGFHNDVVSIDEFFQCCIVAVGILIQHILIDPARRCFDDGLQICGQGPQVPFY